MDKEGGGAEGGFRDRDGLGRFDTVVLAVALGYEDG